VNKEIPIQFTCNGDKLYGMLHIPDEFQSTGLLIVVGGPQYRIGSHRQFVLLSRSLMDEGVASLRFDYRGMGDSDGKQHTFEEIEEDIRIAIDQLFMNCPNLKTVAIWGLCDAASAACMYAHKDPRVSKVILLNPWVRTKSTIAATYIKNYYLKRIFNINLWRKILTGKFNFKASIYDVVNKLKLAFYSNEKSNEKASLLRTSASLPDRMCESLELYNKPILLILSGNDLTAKEFENVTGNSKNWRIILNRKNVLVKRLKEANHTFSKKEWKEFVALWTFEWIKDT